ncbi:HAD-IIB family hydrolase [Aurantivibrio plasticivorans]
MMVCSIPITTTYSINTIGKLVEVKNQSNAGNNNGTTSPLSGDWVIVSDLDGTLLDHHTYSHAAIDNLLKRLDTAHVPVVFNSSKTRPEMLVLREAMHNQHPFIVENGSAIFFPEDYFSTDLPSTSLVDGYRCLVLGATRNDVLAFLENDANQYGQAYLSFAKASVADIVEATGLSEQQASQAKQREFSEPLLWQGSDEEKQAFIKRAEDAGFNTLQGGRFLHVIGQTDKGKATQRLVLEYQQQAKKEYRLLASGDSPNDIDMLAVADIAVVVKSPVQKAPTFECKGEILYSDAEGPEGWREVVEPLFQER